MMNLREKFQSMFNFNTSKKNNGLWRDNAKYTLIVSKIILSLISFWPENYNLYTKISFFTITGIYILIQMSLLMYLVTSIDGIVPMTRTMSTFALGMQVMAKLSILYFRSKELKKIIKIIKYEFWPSNTFGQKVEDQIRQESKSLLLAFIIPYASAVTFLTQISLTPLIKGVRILPYDSWYPFNWELSPTYEIVYALELYMTLFINGNVVCGTDFLYCSICANCTVQFRLLCCAIKQIGRGNEKKLTEYLLRIPGHDYQPVFNKEFEEERKLFVICVKHHQKLLNICSQLNHLFNYGHFYQLVASITGLCAVCYLITAGIAANGQSFLASYFIGFVVQLLLYCGVSNELSYWSEELGKDAFKSAWYNKDYKDIRQCLSIMINRTQKQVIMKALGLFELSYASFLLVMRFTFSLYTFLDSMTKK